MTRHTAAQSHRHLGAGYAMFKIRRTQRQRKADNSRRATPVWPLTGLPLSARCGLSIFMWGKCSVRRAKGLGVAVRRRPPDPAVRVGGEERKGGSMLGSQCAGAVTDRKEPASFRPRLKRLQPVNVRAHDLLVHMLGLFWFKETSWREDLTRLRRWLPWRRAVLLRLGSVRAYTELLRSLLPPRGHLRKWAQIFSFKTEKI